MSLLEINNFSFRYRGANSNALNSVSFSVENGEMVLLFGASGCGKTTLFSNIKKEIAPKGERKGEILFNNIIIDKVNPSLIGFVSQNPDNQYVADTVYRELAFGLENTIKDAALIRRRIAETACYFGVTDILDKKISELSGGQKQLCNLAAVLCLDPSVIILDEPLSQLDPIASEKFLNELIRVNKELGIAVIISEHFTENILSVCTKAIHMESGEIKFCGAPQKFAEYIVNKKLEYIPALPAACGLSCLAGQKNSFPLSVNEGRNSPFIADFYRNYKKNEDCRADEESNVLLVADDIRYAYKKNEPPVLKGADIEIRKGEIHVIVGGNAAGKSTFLKVLSGCCKPNKGRLKYDKNIRTALLPQDVKLLFRCETLVDDLSELKNFYGYSDKDIADIIDKFNLRGLEKRHPYDLSCGEMQRAAIAKLLLIAPDILMLDEPVKGLDVIAKNTLADILKNIKLSGKACLVVTHDLDFAASVADRITMLSCGSTVCSENTEVFLKNNRFFTTAKNRILKNLI